MRRAWIIRNPAARRAISTEQLRAAADALTGWEIEFRDTRDADGPEVLGRHAVGQGAHAVIACGGDGTLNGVLNGVRSTGNREVSVGLIPAGTANVWAREAGISRDPAEALRLLDIGRSVRVDLGVARVGERERRFLLMCSAGFDAAVVERVERMPRVKRALAQGAFVVGGARVMAWQRPVPATFDWGAGAARRSVFIVVAGNSRLYGGVSRLTSAARMDDGLLDLACFEARAGWRGIGDVGTHLVRGVVRGQRPWHGVSVSRFEYQRAAHIEVRPEVPLPLQVDGEFFTTATPEEPLTLDADPQAVRLLVPPGHNPLFDPGQGVRSRWGYSGVSVPASRR